MANLCAVRLVGLFAALTIIGPSLQGCTDASDQCAAIMDSNTTRTARRRLTPQGSGSTNNIITMTKADLLQNLEEFVSGSAFIDNIMQVTQQIPDVKDINIGGATQDQLSVWQGACQVEYAVGASVKGCDGLKSIVLSMTDNTSVNEVAPGQFTASIAMELSVGPVTCTASACARGSACGIDLAAAATVTPSLSINKASVQMDMNVVQGDDPTKVCLQVTQVVASGGVFDWGNLHINFNGRSAEIPDHVLDRVWERVRLDDVIGTLEDEVSSALETQLQTMNTCF